MKGLHRLYHLALNRVVYGFYYRGAVIAKIVGRGVSKQPLNIYPLELRHAGQAILENDLKVGY